MPDIMIVSLNLSGFVAGRSGPSTGQNRPFWICSRWQGPTQHTTYLSCLFWGKASNFRGLFAFLLHRVATINIAYIENFHGYV